MIKCKKEVSHCIWLSMVLIDCVFKMGENYLLQMFLKTYKYISKEVTRNVNDELEIFSDDSDESDG